MKVIEHVASLGQICILKQSQSFCTFSEAWGKRAINLVLLPSAIFRKPGLEHRLLITLSLCANGDPQCVWSSGISQLHTLT